MPTTHDATAPVPTHDIEDHRIDALTACIQAIRAGNVTPKGVGTTYPGHGLQSGSPQADAIDQLERMIRGLPMDHPLVNAGEELRGLIKGWR